MTRILFIKPLFKKKYIFTKPCKYNAYIIVIPHMLSPQYKTLMGYYLLLYNKSLPYSNIEPIKYVNNYLKLKNPRFIKSILFNNTYIHYVICEYDDKKFWLDTIKKDTLLWYDNYIHNDMKVLPINYEIDNFKIDNYEIAYEIRKELFNI